MATLPNDKAFYPIDGNGKVTVGDLKATIMGGSAMGGSANVVNSLTSKDATAALSAAQGKVLKDALDALTLRVTKLER